ncbi:NUDIX domain-containing protein [uncultured Clostridium sp.]|uniref:NUDIX hydrolase n=1 Tax=uncultured Clostridium sp. TaxID=59620 RepID=UPI0025FA9E98|nr:NUDIX domain-containing protein [uncultured Clostridium sp.]
MDEEKEFLKKYSDKEYDKPSVTNDVLIFTTEDIKDDNIRKVPRKGLQVLLIKRDQQPDKDMWCIPGGFIRKDESLEEGAARKLKEKTGIEDMYLEQLYTFGDVERDKRTRVITISNMALVAKEKIKTIEVDSLKEKKWFWVEKHLVESKNDLYIENKYKLNLKSEDDEVEIAYDVVEKIEKGILRKKSITYILEEQCKDKLAFDHYKILDYGIDRLRNKVEYTPIAFNLLPKLFTVIELQYVYEAIMGRKILNFRRKMNDFIIETNEKIEGKPHRPAKVFKFNEEFKHDF